MSSTQYYGTGRRKSSTARVFLRPGKGDVIVNQQPLDEYFGRETSRMVVRQPLELTETLEQFDAYVTVKGGGNTGQAGAVRMGLSRALLALYPDAHGVLSEAGHFTRDPRMVERKKYGRHGARRGHQWGKR